MHAALQPTDLLRDRVLDGQVVAVLGPDAPAPAAEGCRALGAAVVTGPLGTEEEVAALIAGQRRLDTVVIDAAAAFAAARAGAAAAELDPFRAACDGAWAAARASATGAMIDGGGGKLVLLAPPAGDPVAGALRAALENMARTLSVEWSRHQIRPTAILPAPATEPGTVASLVAYLASAAGDYFAGCAFTLTDA